MSDFAQGAGAKL